MTLRQARKIMRKYYRTGIRPREATFCKAFNRTKLPGCRYVRPFNIGKSMEKAEKLFGPPPLALAVAMQKFLNFAYEHLVQQMFPAAPIQIPRE